MPSAFKIWAMLYNTNVLGISIEFLFQKNRAVKKRNYKYLRSPLALIILFVIGVVLIKSTGGDFAVYGQR